ILVGGLDPLLREFLGLLVGDRGLVGELARPLERRELGEIPGRLQIRMAVGARRRRLLRLRRQRDGEEEENAERKGTHGAAPFETDRIDGGQVYARTGPGWGRSGVSLAPDWCEAPRMAARRLRRGPIIPGGGRYGSQSSRADDGGRVRYGWGAGGLRHTAARSGTGAGATPGDVHQRRRADSPE